MDSVVLGKNIHKARRDRCLSGDKLSELCNVTPAYLRQVEAGSKTPSLPLFVTLCDKLCVSPSQLLAGVVSEQIDDVPEELKVLCRTATPAQLKLISALLQAALKECR